MTRALIVVDVQNEYFPGGKLPLFEAAETEARIINAIARARAAGDRVILIRHEAEGGDGIFAPGSSGTAIRPGILAAAGNAPVVTKHFADSFQDTDLETHLAGIDSLLICGMMTQNCVTHTAISKSAEKYDVSILTDCCTTVSEMIHAIALRAVSTRVALTTADQAL